MPQQPKMANSPAPHTASSLSATERHETVPMYSLFFLGIAALVLVVGAIAYVRRRSRSRRDDGNQ